MSVAQLAGAAATGTASPVPAIPEEETAPEGPVDVLKELQRSNPTGREQWGAYCDLHGGGVRDPSKHEAPFVETFLAQFEAGQRLEVVSETESLADLVKQGQRKSAPWKQAWAAYCQAYGGGINDPAKHEHAFLKGFLDFLGQQGSMVLSGNVMGMRSGGGGGGGRPRRSSGGGGGGGGGHGAPHGGYMEPKKMALVWRIKAFQRMGEDQKALWGAHCDSQLGGVRDPMRHDSNALQAFCSKNSVP